jgi:hypothetical protein
MMITRPTLKHRSFDLPVAGHRQRQLRAQPSMSCSSVVGSFGTSPPAGRGQWPGMASHEMASLGSSPPTAPLRGASPPPSRSASGSKGGSDKAACAGAKKMWKRICFDKTLTPSDFTIGFMESVQQKVRQSGAGAWSLRVHDTLSALPFEDFQKRFGGEGGGVPFHRIVYFLERGAVVWESDYYRKKLAASESPVGASGGGAGTYGSSPPSATATASRASSSLPPHSRHVESARAGSGALERICGELLGGSSDEEGSERTGGYDDEVAGLMDGDGLDADRPDGSVCGADLDPERELELPEECWMAVLGHCDVREVCMLGRTNRWLRVLASTPSLWTHQYARLFGEPPVPALNGATVRRKCRHSCIRAARWLEADVVDQAVGFPDTVCLQLDDRKVVSGDGCCVRVWSHEEGRRYRRIATLKGHSSPVTCVAYDDNHIVSGDTSGVCVCVRVCVCRARHYTVYGGPYTV